ncbi:hypothetical protein IGI04_020434 [Brassica rapa subsp. trilocularis]|uniref:Uncharacterized protein n=1 Tax=Brassica rapa subsp. trilocularis TaxID=1813537 RepID=A0ABQ7ML43_BRACM|nr:hypothetical protein IGI04_020434 [Brassica rapa subsp. trilocularis]
MWEWKMSSAAILHVLADFLFLNISRREMRVKNGYIDGNGKKFSCGDWCQEYREYTCLILTNLFHRTALLAS